LSNGSTDSKALATNRTNAFDGEMTGEHPTHFPQLPHTT
jgi:hypothetical protein